MVLADEKNGITLEKALVSKGILNRIDALRFASDITGIHHGTVHLIISLPV
jgi:hypothetical protein